MVITLARNWWALPLRGLYAVNLSIAVYVWPGVLNITQKATTVDDRFMQIKQDKNKIHLSSKLL